MEACSRGCFCEMRRAMSMMEVLCLYFIGLVVFFFPLRFSVFKSFHFIYDHFFLFTCMYICEGVRFSGTGITDSCHVGAGNWT